MFIVAGCPASGRAWVIKQWVSHLRRSAEHAGVDLMIYTLIPDEDTATACAVTEACATHAIPLMLEHTQEEPKSEEFQRDWGLPRYEEMASLRTSMLNAVRMLEPDLFLSVDSDILLDRNAIASMIEALESNPEYAAMGSKTWLHPSDVTITNGATLSRFNTLQRLRAEMVLPAHVLMAIVMMTPNAYWVDYAPDPKGEDIGWSNKMSEAGLKMGFDGRVASKHVMSPGDLHKIDFRVGW